MPTTNERLRSLVEGLGIATNNGSVKWSKSTGSDGFAARVGDSSVEITTEPGETDTDDIRITIYNANGEAVESFTDAYFGQQTPKNLPQRSYYGVMSVLLEGARRSATGADKIVDNILEKLGTPRVSDQPSNDLDDGVPF